MDIQIAYRDHRINGSSSDSDSDSNDESDVWKRHPSNRVTKEEESTLLGDSATLPVPPPPVLPVPEVTNSRKRKVNKIWSNVLEEETVVSELCQIGLDVKCPDNQNRNIESYNYRLKYSDPRREQDMEMDSSMQDDQGEPTEDLKEKLKFKRQRKFGSTGNLSCGVKDEDDAGNRFPRLSRADLEVARKIVHVLGERKHYLIYRVVHVIGAEKAFQLLRMTEDIEEQGGMLIKNNTRRRTPGGVYLQLLKSDKDVTAEQVAEIFAHEVPFEKFKEFRKLHGKMNKPKGNIHKRKKKKKKSKSSNDDDDPTKMVCEESAVVEEPNPAEEVLQTSPCSPASLPVDTANCVFGNGAAAPSPISTEAIKEEPESDIEEGEIVDT